MSISCAERNLRAKELEKIDLSQAINLYEENVKENFEGDFPYDRLIAIYKKQRRIEDAVRVAKRAIFVFEKIVSKQRSDRIPKLEKFRICLCKLEGHSPEIKQIKPASKSNIVVKARSFKPTEFIEDYTSIDVETTGFSPTTDSIIELAAVRVRNGSIAEKFSSLVHVDDLPRKITTLTGITAYMLFDAPKIEDALEAFIGFVGNDIVVGHNVNFDIGFINESCIECFSKPFANAYVDTYALSRRIIPPGKTPDYKLSTLVDLLNLPPSKSHRAEADALSTIQLYNYLKSAASSATV